MEAQKTPVSDPIRKIVQKQFLLEMASPPDKRVQNFVKWIKTDDNEAYAFQGDQTDMYFSIGMIYKNLLHGKIPASDVKWIAIEPVYGDDFEEATKLLVEWVKDNLGVDIGKKYDLPGGMFAVEMLNVITKKGYKKKILICLKNGKKIGTYFPDIQDAVYFDNQNAGTFPNLKTAAFAIWMNYEQNSRTPKG